MSGQGERPFPKMATHLQTAAVLVPSEQEQSKTQLIVGPAVTGAKFTPTNHHNTDDPVLDSILRGDYMAVHPAALAQEIKAMYGLGARYFHIHARNPETREQSCDPELYRQLGKMLRAWMPEIILSSGASRNGREIVKAINQHSEWGRLIHSCLTREDGGADFVTIQAAAELKIMTDLEQQGYIRYCNNAPGGFIIVKDLKDYVPASRMENLSIGAHSTAGGGDYGFSSAKTQWEVFQRAIATRGEMGLPQEVEWTQLARSCALTKLALDHFNPGLGNTGRLNITILFGFSPLLPFPLTWSDFRRAVDLARSLQVGDRCPALDLSVSVGAAVLPTHAAALTAPLDVGACAGKLVGPLERLIAYACMPHSDVDVLRFGLEDTPFLQGPDWKCLPTTNPGLAEFVFERLAEHGGEPVTDPVRLRRFVSTAQKWASSAAGKNS